MSIPVEASKTSQVRKRSGSVVDFNRQKITQAVLLCLVNDCGRASDANTRALAEKVTAKVEKIAKRMTAQGPVEIETIQDLVEQQLMAIGEHEAARQYILYRDTRAKLRAATQTDPRLAEAVAVDRQYAKTDIQLFQHYDKYARFAEEHRRRETVVEATRRAIGFLRWEIEVRHGRVGVVDAGEWTMLENAMLEALAVPSMRLQQTAGPAAQRCNVGIYNCSFAGLSDLDYFHEGLYISMQGTGHAFSCENWFVEKLPQIKFQRTGYAPEKYTVEDSTEGWCRSVKVLAERLYDGYDLDIDYSLVRPAGSRLKTKGGTASGPKPLFDLHMGMRRLIKARQGRRLRDIDAHDWMCYIGEAGEMGGFRRAALLSLSDLDSEAMRIAKFGQFYKDPLRSQRTMANNSAAYDQKPDAVTFMREWLSLAESKSGERGIFNRGSIYRQMPQRRADAYAGQRVFWGCNPCGEIYLHPDGQFCNLSMAICRPDDTEATLMAKVEIAAIFGTLQSMLTTFSYLRPRWKENCERERLLGVDLAGAVDCPLLRDTNPDRDRLLGRLLARVRQTNVAWAQRLGIVPSTAVTCIKPGGNSGQRYGVGQSMSGWLTAHMIRNVEVGIHNPMYKFLKDQGVPWETSYRDPETAVFSFPLKAPEGSQIVADLMLGGNGRVQGIQHCRSALRQLEDWLAFKKHWTEHNPSVSIYVADHEWLEVGNWVYAHWDDVGGLSFFPLDGGVYPQAPFTPVSADDYAKFVANFPTIEWEKLARYDGGSDHTNVNREKACSGDKCVL